MARFRRILLLALAAALLPVTLFPRPSAAQDVSLSNYWTYDAPGPITLVTEGDFDGDGTDSFVVITQDNIVILLSATGRPLWSRELEDSLPAVLLTPIRAGAEDPGKRSILVVTEDELRLLSSTGQPLWQQPLLLPVTPDSVDDDPEQYAAFLEQHRPAAVSAFDRDGDGIDEILLILRSGLLALYDHQGNHLWTYVPEDPPADNGRSFFDIGDIDRDGTPEIVYSYFGGRFSKLALLDGAGSSLWGGERPIDGQVTALSLAGFDPADPMSIAIGNSLGRVHLYDFDGQERWFRTPNRPVTSLAPALLPAGPALLVGTDTGAVAAYNDAGDRYWRTIVADSPDRSVTGLSVGPTLASLGQPAIAVTLTAGAAESQELTEVYLLDGDGHRLHDEALVSVPGATRLVDVNRDNLNELLLVSFGTLALVDSGTSARKNAPAWNYRLFVAPQAVLAADITGDGRDELLLGAGDGRLHMLESDAGQQATWIQKLGDQVPLLAVMPAAEGTQPLIVAVSAERPADADTFESTLHLLDANGRDTSDPLIFSDLATALTVADLNADGQSEIFVGTGGGELSAVSADLGIRWQLPLGSQVTHLLPGAGGSLLASTADSRIYAIDHDGNSRLLVSYNLHDILHLLLTTPAEGSQPNMLVTTSDGVVHRVTLDGREVSRFDLGDGVPTVALQAGDDQLIATDNGRLFQIDSTSQLVEWELPAGAGISALSWGDLSGGGAEDLAVGNRSGAISLYGSDGRIWDEQGLTSGIFALVGVDRGLSDPLELAAVTDLGVVQLFEAKPNRPPLLVNPRVLVEPGRYEISVDVLDEEGDSVQVTLETWDSAAGSWIVQGVEDVEGAARPSFAISPTDEEPVRYRFLYNDQSQSGIIEPPPGPVALRVNRELNAVLGIALAAVLGLSTLFFARQALSPESRARRLYGRIRQQPAATLELIEKAYQRSAGEPGLLLSLANRARGDKNMELANLADGLFLLSARPEAGLAIINGALDSAQQLQPVWRDLAVWRPMFRVGQTLYEAPNVTELTLLYPQLAQLVKEHETGALTVPGVSLLLRVLAGLRDSERVDLVEDRLYYLHESTVLLRQLRQDQKLQPTQVMGRLVGIIAARWLGLVNAAIEELRGQAQPVVKLKTRQLILKGEVTTVTLEITNTGRARAENVELHLDDSAAYTVIVTPDHIPALPPGRSREISVVLRPHVIDSFRLSCTVHYSDRSQEDRRMAFGDMVHLLAPVREFTPVPNPYLPGTPLREYSPLFYGREELFDFIAQNADRLSQRNVLILIGQRRTGKTSALLRLGSHLPDTLVPVYVDCQSLGVLPGMASLFHDLAWMIADALALRNIELEVPEPGIWREDPAGYFQRRFLPYVHEQLPAESTLLLVFDEFEAFENLVRDEILPPTFFTYLRHLMQHSRSLSFVFVGTRRLEEMSSDYWSVLFNIALYRHIGFLSHEAAIRLICEPVAPHIVYDDLALNKIWRVTAGHPYFLQLVCYTLVNQANTRQDGYVTISDVNAAISEMLRLGEVHFAYLWQRSSFIERALLAAVAHLMDRDVPFHPADLAHYLEQFGFQFDPAELTEGLNRLVEREIMQETTLEGTTLYELKIGLVGLWAEENKSLSKLYASKESAPAPTYA